MYVRDRGDVGLFALSPLPVLPVQPVLSLVLVLSATTSHCALQTNFLAVLPTHLILSCPILSYLVLPCLVLSLFFSSTSARSTAGK